MEIYKMMVPIILGIYVLVLRLIKNANKAIFVNNLIIWLNNCIILASIRRSFVSIIQIRLRNVNIKNTVHSLILNWKWRLSWSIIIRWMMIFMFSITKRNGVHSIIGNMTSRNVCMLITGRISDDLLWNTTIHI